MNPQSITSKKIFDDDKEDDTISIQGILSPTELMEIASTMQSKSQKKIMKARRIEAQTIQSVVDILSSIFPETDINILSTPIDKLEQLVTTIGQQMMSLEEATIKNVEKKYETRRIE